MSRYFTYFPKIEYQGETITDITRRVALVKKLQRNQYAMLPFTVEEGESAEEIAYYYYGDPGYSWLIYLANDIFDPYSQWPMSNDDLIKAFDSKYAYSRSFAQTAVNTTNNTITIVNHNLKSTDPLVYTSRDQTAIGGLTSGTTYYVIPVDYNTIKLASSIQNAKDQIRVDLTSRGVGTHGLYRNLSVFKYNSTLDSNIAYIENVADPTVNINIETYNTLDIIPDEWNVVRYFEYESMKNDSHRTIKIVDKKYITQIEQDLKRLMNE